MGAVRLLRLSLPVALLVAITAATAGAGEVTPGLADELRFGAPGELHPVIIVLNDGPDYDALRAEVADLPREEQRRRVVTSLRESARAVQEALLADLRQYEAGGEAANIRSFWVASMVSAELTAEAAYLVARRPEVAVVSSDAPVYMLDATGPRAATEPDATRAGPERSRVGNLGETADRDIAWGVLWIGADLVWEYGYEGQGVIVSVLDTGVWYQHTDLTNRMWRNEGDPWPPNGDDDDGNGYADDYYGYDFAYNDHDPNDVNGHGTHCSGTVAGDGTGGTQTGVAPQANIMACKVLSDSGNGQPSNVVEAIQYSIDNGAHVMSLSIGWFHPTLPTRQMYREACTTAELAGVVMSVAAGNEAQMGDPPTEIRSPGDVPSPWIHPDNTGTGGTCGVTTIGATGYHNDVIAYFSSRGPVTWGTVAPWNDWSYPPGLIKPDVCAPGVNVNSTLPGGGYSGNNWSGTSMATPHVSGTVALMLSRDMSLSPAQVDQCLEETALELGGPGKDNDYGSGRIQALDAVMCGVDELPPAAVTDLATHAAPPFGRLRLTWTAPGDDGTTGTASEYDVRYQPAFLGPIDTQAEWNSATQAVYEPTPQPAGTPETMVLRRLGIGKSYYFALKTADEAPNWSDLSNSPEGTGSGEVHGPTVDPVIIDGAGRIVYAQGDGATITRVGLAQSYPNPLVERAEIAFALPQAAPVRLHVYTVTGELVRVLVDEQVSRGLHRVAWDGRNETGGLVANGIYFYRLETPEETLGRKLTVLH